MRSRCITNGSLIRGIVCPVCAAATCMTTNIYVDDTLGLAAKRLRDARAAAMSSASTASKLNNTYSFNPFLNGSISTEGGAMLVEKSVYIDCVTPLRATTRPDPDGSHLHRKNSLASTRFIRWTIPWSAATAPDPGNPLGCRFKRRSFRFSRGTRIQARPPASACRIRDTMDDPAQLQAIVTSPTAGAGLRAC